MKLLILVFVLFFSTALPSQVDTTFSELRGMDDASGTTHLFYRKYSYQDLGGGYWRRHNDVYHLDLATQSDTLIFGDYFHYTSFDLGGPTTNDFEFWDNDPAKYISCGAYSEVDPVALIWRYDAGAVWQWLGEVAMIEISRQNDSLLYAYFNGLLKSTDKGYTWNYDSSAAPYFNLLTISPYDDQIFFSSKYGNLYKSINSGMSYALVDSSINWGNSYLFFDSDSFHVYGITLGYNQSRFLSSSDAGNSWNLLSTSSNKMQLSVDPFQSGTVFLSNGSEIQMSSDYGNAFNPYWQLTRPVVGLYKKPNSDILYAATTKDIYEMTSTDTVSIKHLPTIPVSIDDTPHPVAKDFMLYQNYPNPFNPTTTIRFSLPQTSHVSIELFNITGQKVAVLLDERKEVGYQSVQFNAGQLASGVYFYRLTTKNFASVKKMVLMR